MAALVLMIIPIGLALAGRGIYLGARATRSRTPDPAKALGIFRAFRVAIVGLSIAGIGTGWLLGASWLLGLSLLIGAEELLESSFAIATLRRGVAAEPSQA